MMTSKPYMTGWCSTGCHQGVTKTSRSGAEFPQCRGEVWRCTCWCHKLASQFGGAESPSEAPSNGRRVIVGPAPVGPATCPPRPAPVPPTFTPTPTGRRARGELEWTVLEVVGRYLEAGIPATPAFISGAIEGAPSTGAVQAVLERWVRQGFASPLERNPVALVSLTDEGRSLGLQGIKDRDARLKRSRHGEDKRTGRRR